MRTPRQLGLIQARLAGARAATGSFIVFLDSHCEATKGWLEPMAQRMKEDPTVIQIPRFDRSCWGAGVTTPLWQDRHDRLINALLLRVGLRIGLCWRIHMVWSLHMGGAACQGEDSDVIDMFLNSCKGGGFSKANRSSKDCHNGRRPLCS